MRFDRPVGSHPNLKVFGPPTQGPQIKQKVWGIGNSPDPLSKGKNDNNIPT